MEWEKDGDRGGRERVEGDEGDSDSVRENRGWRGEREGERGLDRGGSEREREREREREGP